jgi:formate-dependent nitrite reductase cytochrome c552 subunit
MSLTVDSSPCEECHSTTFEQWENTTHAEAGVSCIGCHKSHSLQSRLSDSDHCGSCHKERLEDFSKSAHALADVACTDCHLSSSEATADNVTLISNHTDADVQAPSHDFTKVSAEDCIKCHTQDAHRGLPATSDKEHVEKARIVAMANSVPQLAAKLETSEHKNQSLLLLTPAMLGLGIAIGGALGIASVMLFCYINQKKGVQQ